MPTDIIKKIGATNSPTTMDYTTLQTWEDASTVDLVSADQRWIGESYDQGEFTGSGTQLTISGQTVDATRYVILRCASGASFRDKAGVRTTALDYNASNGVAVRTTGNYNRCIGVSTQYTRIDGIQAKITGAAVPEVLRVDVTHCLISNCIARGDVSASGIIFGSGGSSGDTKFVNCLGITGTGNEGIFLGVSGEAHGCTVIRTGGTGGVAGIMPGNYSTSIIRNCACFGFTSFHNAQGVAAGSGFNGTDLASAPGSNNQTSLTFSSQFTSTTVDFRAVSTGTLDLNGTPDATNLSVDISNTARDAATPTIGCWEVVAAAASGQPTAKRMGGVLHAASNWGRGRNNPGVRMWRAIVEFFRPLILTPHF